MHDRAEKYRELRAHVPADYLKAAKAFRINDKLTWFRVSDATTGEPIALTTTTTRVSRSLSRGTIASTAYNRAIKEQPVSTVGEFLALFLTMRLADLKDAERRESGDAPVRLQKLPSRRAIADIAVDLLDTCRRRTPTYQDAVNDRRKQITRKRGGKPS